MVKAFIKKVEKTASRLVISC